MKVHIRQRKQSKAGSISLFLEIYKGTTTTPEGKVKNLRDYEYLNLYLIDKPKTPIEKQGNKDTLQLAESIRAKRELEMDYMALPMSLNKAPILLTTSPI